MRALIPRVRRFWWHVAVHVAGNGIVDLETFIRRTEVLVVIDLIRQIVPSAALQQRMLVDNATELFGFNQGN